ncbi:amino acid permease [Phlyctema vagabunda]|uniref:Amino acid permease n=1 Tax=Phlyctema vagabunda TaxID=108571 RepID=A0ABR4PT93_9HELO
MSGSNSNTKRSFIGAAISTAASPLSNNFELNCRSPVTPRTPRRPSRLENRRPNGLYVNTESARYSFYNNGAYIRTPQALSRATKNNHGQSTYAEDQNGLRSPGSSTTLVPSSTENSFFLSTTPSYPTRKTSSSKLGTCSAISLILGKTVGVGIYSIPASIYVSVGSVGMALLMWILGALLSFCGLAVYLDLGTAMPKSGGERVYLERIFKRPYMLSTCMFLSYVILLGFSAPNAIVLGNYVMYALGVEINRWNVRVIAVGVITFLCFIHKHYPRIGLRIINVLGVGKMLILAVVILCGVAGAALGIGATNSVTAPLLNGRRLATSNELHTMGSTAQRNFSNIFEGSSTQPYDYATALLKVLYCFRGYSTANTVLSSVRNPIPTLKVAAPVALSLVSIGYILFATSLFLIVELSDFKSSGTTITGHFFRNIFGEVLGERILPCFIIISAFGNIAATSFAQARVNQELGKDGLLPLSHFFQGRSSICNGVEASPTAGLFIHWLVSVLVILVPPPGEIYNFLVDIGGYPVSVISVAISGGLLYLQLSPGEKYDSPFRARKTYTSIFMLSNCLLLILPWVKPTHSKGNSRFPYYAYPATALAILGSGAVYWIWWAKLKSLISASQSPEQGGRRHKTNASYDARRGRHSGDDERRELLEPERPEEREEGMRKRVPCACQGCLLRREKEGCQNQESTQKRTQNQNLQPEQSDEAVTDTNKAPAAKELGPCRCEGCCSRRHQSVS